ncbi:MAG: DUF1232 domain-containing protein [Clostridia bacterium]|nr:DUF1232 domain-containing protein [Clostridia bacterium]
MLKKLKQKAQSIKKDILALYLAGKHKDTPIIVKILIVITTAYAFSPIDLIPDFIPVLGYIDDLIILPAAILLIIKLIPDNVLKQCREEAESMENRPKNYIAAGVIILIWLTAITLIIIKLAKN